jgi:hypothetical protein
MNSASKYKIGVIGLHHPALYDESIYNRHSTWYFVHYIYSNDLLYESIEYVMGQHNEESQIIRFIDVVNEDFNTFEESFYENNEYIRFVLKTNGYVFYEDERINENTIIQHERLRHPHIRNYNAFIIQYTNMNLSPVLMLSIFDYFEDEDGVMHAIDKTCYLRIFQKKVRKYLQKQRVIFNKMANPKYLLKRECGIKY